MTATQTGMFGNNTPADNKIYSCILICRTCQNRIGVFSPHVGQAEKQKYDAIRAHREKVGCRTGIAPLVLTYCAECECLLTTVITTADNGGIWWNKVGHPHDQMHNISRGR